MSPKIRPITFYTKPGCHLCEDGLWIAEIALKAAAVPLETVDISHSQSLTERYGNRIPVLSHPNLPTELGWPFTPESILAWLNTRDGLS